MTRCQFCGRPVSWLATKFGRRMLFNAQPEPVAGEPDPQAWLPGRVKERTVMSPVSHFSRQARASARSVLTLHRCPEYEQALRAAGLDQR